MEELYESLERKGHTNVDGVIEWMKDAHIIDGDAVTEDDARELFEDISDDENVDMETFKHVLTELASEHADNIWEFFKARFGDALKAGASAFIDAFIKKK